MLVVWVHEANDITIKKFINSIYTNIVRLIEKSHIVQAATKEIGKVNQHSL